MVFKCGLLFLVVTIGCCSALESSNGEGCILKIQDSDDEYGVCTAFSDCAYAKGEGCRGHPPQTCSSYDEDDSVCCKTIDECPPLLPGLVNIPVTGYRAWDYCASIAELAHHCKFMGDSWSRDNFCPTRTEIESGDDVKPGDFPHLVFLSTNAEDWSSAFTGTLISEKWVLTSAYVLSKKPVYAKVGGVVTGGTAINIVDSSAHPGYDAAYTYDDIGLIELEKNVTFSKTVLPACLHTGNVLPEEILKDIVTDYKIADVDILPHEECSTLFDETTILPEGVKESTQFCIKQTKGSDLPAGIYGAPVQVYNGASVACTQTILGVFSSNESSTGAAHLTTRVAAYIPWIENKVWPRVPSSKKTKRLHPIIQSIFKK